MRRLLVMAFVAMIGLVVIGCDDSSSSSNGNGNGDDNGSDASVSYTTAWYTYNDVTGVSSTREYSITSEPFDKVAYRLATSSYDGPINPDVDRNYYANTEYSKRPYLTHWSDGEDTLSAYPYGGVEYTYVVARNQNIDDDHDTARYKTYHIYEGDATGNRDDYEFDEITGEYVPPNNDGNDDSGTGDGGDTDDGTDDGSTDDGSTDDGSTDDGSTDDGTGTGT
ncbi:MAG: hypothetical protein LBQ66_08215 [Planctomycetaceae bacterium]|jgi:hypothetical protein|nr:hypothetical protein [Planctomycetaceae bacterium]